MTMSIKDKFYVQRLNYVEPLTKESYVYIMRKADNAGQTRNRILAALHTLYRQTF
jgi:hypothetical protein